LSRRLAAAANLFFFFWLVAGVSRNTGLQRGIVAGIAAGMGQDIKLQNVMAKSTRRRIACLDRTVRWHFGYSQSSLLCLSC
jgi:hypothetical protein